MMTVTTKVQKSKINWERQKANKRCWFWIALSRSNIRSSCRDANLCIAQLQSALWIYTRLDLEDPTIFPDIVWRTQPELSVLGIFRYDCKIAQYLTWCFLTSRAEIRSSKQPDPTKVSTGIYLQSLTCLNSAQSWIILEGGCLNIIVNVADIVKSPSLTWQWLTHILLY